MSKMIGDAFIIRNASDYDDAFIASKTGTQEQIEHAEYVHQRIKNYIDNILDGEKGKAGI